MDIEANLILLGSIIVLFCINFSKLNYVYVLQLNVIFLGESIVLFLYNSTIFGWFLSIALSFSSLFFIFRNSTLQYDYENSEDSVVKKYLSEFNLLEKPYLLGFLIQIVVIYDYLNNGLGDTGYFLFLYSKTSSKKPHTWNRVIKK